MKRSPANAEDDLNDAPEGLLTSSPVSSQSQDNNTVSGRRWHGYPWRRDDVFFEVVRLDIQGGIFDYAMRDGTGENKDGNTYSSINSMDKSVSKADDSAVVRTPPLYPNGCL